MPDQTSQTNAAGDIVTYPFLGCEVLGHAYGMAIVLRLRYAQSQAEPDDPAALRMGGRRLPLVLTAAQALDLAQLLARHAQHILQSSPSGAPN